LEAKRVSRFGGREREELGEHGLGVAWLKCKPRRDAPVTAIEYVGTR